MMSKTQIKFFLITFLSFVTCAGYSQNKSLELYYSLSLLSNNLSSNTCEFVNLNKPSFHGRIILKDSTVLNGRLILNQNYNDKLVTILKIDNDHKLIDNEKVREVLLLNTKENRVKETKFVKINSENKLYRLVYKNDSQLYVYDSSNVPFDNSLEGRVFIKENNRLTDTWNFWSSGEEKDIINYLNKRDETNYKKRDFKSLEELFVKL